MIRLHIGMGAFQTLCEHWCRSKHCSTNDGSKGSIIPLIFHWRMTILQCTRMYSQTSDNLKLLPLPFGTILFVNNHDPYCTIDVVDISKQLKSLINTIKITKSKCSELNDTTCYVGNRAECRRQQYWNNGLVINKKKCFDQMYSYLIWESIQLQQQKNCVKND